MREEHASRTAVIINIIITHHFHRHHRRHHHPRLHPLPHTPQAQAQAKAAPALRFWEHSWICTIKEAATL